MLKPIARDAVFLTLFCGSQLFAQQAQLSGFVKDPSGAVIVRASVAVHNAGTNTESKATTDASGAYSFPLLAPGIYQMTVEANGFETKLIERVAARALCSWR